MSTKFYISQEHKQQFPNVFMKLSLASATGLSYSMKNIEIVEPLEQMLGRYWSQKLTHALRKNTQGTPNRGIELS